MDARRFKREASPTKVAERQDFFSIVIQKTFYCVVMSLLKCVCSI